MREYTEAEASLKDATAKLRAQLAGTKGIQGVGEGIDTLCVYLLTEKAKVGLPITFEGFQVDFVPVKYGKKAKGGE